MDIFVDPMYGTVINNSGGYHGHQIKDVLGAKTIMSLFDLTYLHTPYPYLDNFALQGNTEKLSKWRRHLGFRRVIRIKGPHWDGFPEHDKAKAHFNDLIGVKDAKTLYVFEMAARIHPFQTIPWYQKGLIEKDIFTSIAKETTLNYHNHHGLSMAFNGEGPLRVAMHISRGVDYNKDRFPEHFEDSYNVRYMFPLSYFDKVLEQLQGSLDKPFEVDIYTEALHSDEIVDHFGARENCKVHVGNNRKEKNHDLIHEIFKAFITADILVACNSSFSAMAAYFRHGKPMIYHPHRHLDHLPLPYLATDRDGRFDTGALKRIIA
jgi:hypothetical protein